MSPSLRDELRAATQLHHNAIENTIDLMRPDITMADYVGYLCKFYGYYSGLELCSGLICTDTLISGLFTYGGVYDDETQGTQGI